MLYDFLGAADTGLFRTFDTFMQFALALSYAGSGGQIANTGSHTLDSSTVSGKISASGSWTHLLFKSILLFKRKSPLHLLLKSVLLFKRKSPLCPQDTRTMNHLFALL
jgi:hypothetical protein